MAGITQDISSVLIDHLSRTNLHDVLRTLPTAVDAPFNAYQRQHDPTCLPNTRVDLLRDIYSWADGQNERCIFWLHGLAGTGKSTIARTVARRCLDQKRLGASFFFSRGGGDVGHAGTFVTSIALQLASNVPSLDQYLCDAIKERRDIASQSLRDQWQHLVVHPLSKLSGSGGGQFPYILVVDALDECDNDKVIRIIVHLLADARSLKTAHLQVLLTSRPDLPIRNGFGEVPDGEHRDFVLHNISPPIVDHDISLFLQHNFKLIREEQSLNIDWPGADIIKELVQIAGSLFIWAATAYERVQTLLEGSTYTTAPEEHLNELYNTVLRRSVHPRYSAIEKKELYSMLRHILGSIVVLFSPLSASSLHRLLDVNKHKINQVLKDLHAILDIPEADAHPLRLHHPSFRDFLLNKDRCGDFWVDEKETHQLLATSCIQLMSQTLKKDVCEMHAPGSQASQVESSCIQKCLPPDVQYACLYWVQHLQKSSSQASDGEEAHRFLQAHLLHWLEALGWMGKTSEGIQAILSLEAHVSAIESPDLHAFIYDAKRFALHNRLVIEQAPLQLYCSALVFAPKKSIVRKTFEKCIPCWIQQRPKVQEHWDTLLQTLEGHLDSVTSVAFSPDSKQVVSGSYDATIRLWDAATGAALQTLKGHTNLVTSVAFSPNGKQVVSGSDDKTVRLWDAATGAALQTLEGHSDWVRSVAFSPNGKQVVSGSDDETIRLWDAATGAPLQTLEGHLTWASSVAFSPDGKQLVFGAGDRTVRLWDVATRKRLQTLKGHTNLVTSVAFSPDGKQVVSSSEDQTVRLWDAATGKRLQTLEGHTGSVTSVAFSPDGKLLPILQVFNHWVIENDINILWLPPNYRGTCLATWNRSLAIGHSSRRISFFCFTKGTKLVI
ncbi:uncharacterized protein LY89DRAFT_710917 [Mollisia scopiformis]|uniref:Uncharacterized protein n=1 Tax=Mollisia scopiformis TaxID=149040 RepID=A0A132BCM1_MOLSC|nr:uncharacterized protein LY89DRAFT_710917 [Mollisia scopiformis]KUJ10180.1 hypothetical protein LY89DRAFT_710917 [Mollisia scopiformis]